MTNLDSILKSRDITLPTKVHVYEWFSTRRPTNVRCVTGEGAAAFPAAPREESYFENSSLNT